MSQPSWVGALVPEHLRDREEEVQTLAVRKQVRYWLFRLKTAADGGPKAAGTPRGFRAHFKESEHFDGWENFGVTWDVVPEDPIVTCPRYESVNEEWDHHLAGILRTHTRETRQRQRASNGSEGNIRSG